MINCLCRELLTEIYTKEERAFYWYVKKKNGINNFLRPLF